MKRALGIDLGTSNSSAAVAFDNKTILMAKNKDGGIGPQGKQFPSYVQYSPSGAVLCVGEQARRARRTGFVVWGAKRLIGLSYDAAVERGETRRFSYPIERGPGDTILIRAGSERFSPSHVLEAILREIKTVAENPRVNPNLGGPFDRAVISVPAYFKAIRTAPIIEAAKQAGFAEVDTIAEPTAAAIRYGLGVEREATVLVFDLGGGTLDVTVLQIVQEGDTFVSGELGISGNESLGGMDMDELLCSYVKSQYHLSADDAELKAYLAEAVENAKIRLSDVLETDVDIPIPGAPDIRLSREEVRVVLAKLLERCRTPIRIALRHAGIEAHQLDHVVLVGGPTFMPCVRQLLRDELMALGARVALVSHLDSFVTREDFKRNEVSPTECVAQGAALKAVKLATPVLTVIPEGYGVELDGGRYSSVIETKSSYPIAGEKSILFPDPNAKHVCLTVVAKMIDQEKSRDTDVYYFEPVGDFSISVTPDGNLPEIKCALRVSESKTFSVILEDKKTERTVRYDSANVPALKSGRIQLEERTSDGWKPEAIEGFRSTFQADKASWSAIDLEKLVALAMNVLNRAKGHDNATVRVGASQLHSQLTQAIDGGPSSAPELANAIRQFVFLLLQPGIALIQQPEFDGYINQITDIGTV
ncbi:MAG TPA: Hsp70 family protein [Candidatus Acidoferrales bacterium]|nr:Hsp70 family protein [Candidatus Acidoferrales bacterium]